MNVWRLITHHVDRARALSWTKQSGRIAIGWGLVGDIQYRGYNSSEQIKAAIRRAYPEARNAGLGGPSLWDLYSTMRPGDLVILAASLTRELVVQVEGPYEWREDVPLPEIFGNYNHQRRVKIRNLNPEMVWRAGGGGYVEGASVYRTLIRLAKPLGEDDL